MQDTSPVEFVVRIGGENVAIDLADLLCIRVNGSDGRTLRILPATVGRALQLGADALMAETAYLKTHEIARVASRLVVPGLETELFTEQPVTSN